LRHLGRVSGHRCTEKRHGGRGAGRVAQQITARNVSRSAYYHDTLSFDLLGAARRFATCHDRAVCAA
jgi:hypothetical protein